MENVITEQKGNYILVLRLKKTKDQFISRFGNVHILSGIYLYCGSAHGNGGIRSRVTRHLKNKSKPHWHIDWVKNQMEILEVWSQIADENNECVFGNFLFNEENADVTVRGFGSSDCLQNCQTHFWRFPLEKNIDQLFDRLGKYLLKLNKISMNRHVS